MRNALHGKNIDFSQVTRLDGRLHGRHDRRHGQQHRLDGRYRPPGRNRRPLRQDVAARHGARASKCGSTRPTSATSAWRAWSTIGEWCACRRKSATPSGGLPTDERFHITKHPILHAAASGKTAAASRRWRCWSSIRFTNLPTDKGYPQGRTRERIHMMARILSVADRYDALVSPRPFRPPLTPYSAMECLLAAIGRGRRRSRSGPRAVDGAIAVPHRKLRHR